MKPVLSVLLLIFAIAWANPAAGDDFPFPFPFPFKVTTKRADDRVEVTLENDKAICSVHSPFGISFADFERRGDKWPAALIMRLRLKGLENLEVTSGKVRLQASASLRDGKLGLRIWKNGMEDRPLDSTNPYWIAIRILGADGKPAKELPLQDGYFEIPLPKAIFDSNPKSITVSWIDFYRN